MRLCLLSDIHANREALEACLWEARRSGVERFIVLGDIVGYGPDPEAAVDLVARLAEDGAVVLLGNHDAAIGRADPHMNEVATRAIDWTRGRLDGAQTAFLAELPMEHHEDDSLYVHASACEPAAWHYVIEAAEAAEAFAATSARRIYCGHTHIPAQFHESITGKVATFRPPANKPVPLSTARRWLTVLGAVGQPRDRDPRACFGIVDTDEGCVTFKRVPYDVDATVRKIKDAGLPDRLWVRLLEGR